MEDTVFQPAQRIDQKPDLHCVVKKGGTNIYERLKPNFQGATVECVFTTEWCLFCHFLGELFLIMQQYKILGNSLLFLLVSLP